ncbi:uncharacterized protein KQ657_004008 [Scheffersomyces spartinae]|uniref:STAS domain-containing protein n=1 Tax=Scheffersomyces spartinae TaxID=45513 RepID=A0A9P7VBS9_9ASCO|nr:uncharacterized protein KQ657_004008 [Scheffersomyces spartinae]KAG7194900.1 hypothetical protein KQ657_004008 [Scheffersomyces spartinae]
MSLPQSQFDGHNRRKPSMSEAFVSSFKESGGFEFGGRSYISASLNRQSISAASHSPQVFSGYDVHQESANLARIGLTDPDSEGAYDTVLDKDTPDVAEVNEDDGDDSSTYLGSSPPIAIMGSGNNELLLSVMRKASRKNSPSSGKQYIRYTDDTDINKRPSQVDEESAIDTSTTPLLTVADGRYLAPPIHEPMAASGGGSIGILGKAMKPLKYIPAVFLGTLLNILDGLSYGMIMFPISEAVFSGLAPVGLSMFYLSTIVSQLVYSLGLSAFNSAIGSEMIEVTPFFHTMALSIAADFNYQNKEGILATTIVAYALSSIVTGLTFFLLGKLKLGVLVGFFPRHILVGCIGGVGYFLIATGVEVSSRLEGGLQYNLPTLQYLFQNAIIISEWTIPLILTIILVVLQHRISNSLLVPLYFIAVFVLAHLIIIIVPSWSLESARDLGFVFPAVESGLPWYAFYELYKFGSVDWWSIFKQIPTMLALTFFGVLHVPINVPALAVTVGMDQFDVDRELVAHGYSNVLSGLMGSIQNYLVYTNSVLFIRAGADDSIAGVMLAIATGLVMVAGPVVIGYIPVCVVGSLIYLLGYELLKESLWDTRGRLKKIEYTTVVIIVVTMGALDFVLGIIVGILLACLSFVVEAARTPVVSGIYRGSVVRSTVLRHVKQQDFLKDVGDQICIIKLQGTIFFGSIGGVEDTIRKKFEDQSFQRHPIKYLIVDMKNVQSIDFSAAEGFRRIMNLLNEFNTQLIFSSVFEDDDIIVALRDAGLWDGDNDIKLFNSLNYALEWCENAFLQTYKSVQSIRRIPVGGGGRSSSMSRHNSHSSNSPSSGINVGVSSSSSGLPAFNSNTGSPSSGPQAARNLQNAFTVGTPRTNQVFQAAARTVRDEQKIHNRYLPSGNAITPDNSFKKQPLPLLMIIFLGVSKRDEEFWSRATKFFVKEKVPVDLEFYNTARDSPAIFLVESGFIRQVVEFENSEGNTIHSSILPMTAFGNLFPDSEHMNVSYTTVQDSVVWKLSLERLTELIKVPGGAELFQELCLIQNHILSERFDALSSNILITG